MDGTVSSPKLNPAVSGVRSEESCTQQSRVVAVEVVVEPVVAPVPPAVVPVEVADVQVAVRVAVRMGCRPYHCPSKVFLGAVSYPRATLA